MRLEHVAIAMPDPPAAAAWYAERLGFRIVRAAAQPPRAQFLEPPGGGTLIELFCDPNTPPLDHHAIHGMQAHLAIALEDAAAVAALAADLAAHGASAEGEPARTATGDHYAIVRDPWGVPLQLIARAHPFESR